MIATPTTTLLVIRHGETVWNVQERFQGHGDSPLTETGRRQVLALGRRMRRMNFDALISSDLGRARETAEIIAGQTGHPVATDSRLRERNFGMLEGLTFDEIAENHGLVLERLYADEPDYVVPGGESHRQHYARNIGFVEEWMGKNAGATAAIVVHGGVLDSLFRYTASLPLTRPRCYATTNASLSIFSHGVFYGTLRWVIRTWGDVGHLEEVGYYPGLG